MSVAAEGGFAIIPNWVIRESDLSGHEILVYLALLNRVNTQGLAWPSIARIARESRTSESTVRRTLTSLETRGLVTKQVRPRGDGTNESNLYRVAVFQRNPSAGGYHTDTPRVSDRQGGGSSVTGEEDPLEEDTLEEDVRSELPFGRDSDAFGFIDPIKASTPKQLAYLHDLHIHYNNDIPTDALKARWVALDSVDAATLIDRYLAQMPRHDQYEGPEDGEATFAALSPTGQQWAEAGMIP